MSDKQTKPAPRGVVSWIFGIAFMFLGFLCFIGSAVAAIAFLLAAALVLPPTRQYLAAFRINPSRFLRALLVAILVVVGLGGIVSAVPATSPRVKYEPQEQAAQQEEVTQNEAPAPAAPQQGIEDRIKAIAANTGGTDISFRSIEQHKDDPDRPAGARIMAVSLGTKDIWTASSFYRDTGEVTSRIFREAFTDPDIYDVDVRYYGKVTDQYGRKSDDLILSYSIDKATFLKIAWDNFDDSKLCDFLKAEGLRNGYQAACVANVKID